MIAFLDWLTFENILKAIADAISAAWNWFKGIIEEKLTPLWSPVKEAYESILTYKDQATAWLDGLTPYLEFVNAWVPVTLFMQLLGLYCIFWSVLVFYRSVKKWIPTVSG